jgi:hypothetical protein
MNFPLRSSWLFSLARKWLHDQVSEASEATLFFSLLLKEDMAIRYRMARFRRIWRAPHPGHDEALNDLPQSVWGLGLDLKVKLFREI